MPLQPGNSQSVISSNIHELTHHGSRPRSHEQIVAIALANADRHPHRAGGGMGMPGIKAPSIGGMGLRGGMGHVNLGEGSTGSFLEKTAAHNIRQGIGHVHLDIGGMSASEESPWTERSAARTINDVPFTHGGMIGGSGAGRTDRLPLAVGAESHVIPADVMSAIGQGTTAHGGNVLQSALGDGVGPYDTKLPSEIHGHGPPKPPGVPKGAIEEKSGGHVQPTSILAASGEFVVRPDQVQAIGERAEKAGWLKKGESPMMAGHRLLDEMIHRVRKYQIDWLKHAPAPKKKHGGEVGGFGLKLAA